MNRKLIVVAALAVAMTAVPLAQAKKEPAEPAATLQTVAATTEAKSDPKATPPAKAMNKEHFSTQLRMREGQLK